MFQWMTMGEETEHITIEQKEEEFNNVVRVYIIHFLTFIVLYLFAYFILKRFHQKRERDGLYGEDEDAKAYRISFYLCTFTLAVSFGSVFMLPMSMIGNEIVHLYPESYWVEWLNGALIHTFWKWIFFLSNLSLFVLLPFSYFFTESEGFSGQRRGLMPRVYETIAVLLLLAALVFGLAVLALAFFDNDDSAQGLLLLVGEYYLQYLYSFLLCLCMLVIIAGCAPLGFTVLFDAVGQVLVKPKIFENNDERILAAKLEEEASQLKLKSRTYMQRITKSEREDLRKNLEKTHRTRVKLERRKNASALERNLGYPLVMLLLLALTGLALFLVSFHVLKLIFVGDNELHPSTVTDYNRRTPHLEKVCEKPPLMDEELNSSYWWMWWSSDDGRKKPSNTCKNPPPPHSPSLGANSLSSFGIFGTFLEVLVIIYLTIASVVGLYNLPGFRMLRPELSDTTMTKIILNCLVFQLISSAQPVLSRVLGITYFDLQGNFGNLYWLGNFYVVFGFNVVFAVITALCLVNKMTKKMRRALLKALRFNAFHSTDKQATRSGKPSTSGLSSSPGKKHTNPPPSPKPQVKTPTPHTSCDLDPPTTSKHLEDEAPLLDTPTPHRVENLGCNGLTVGDERTPFCCTPSRNVNLTRRSLQDPQPEIHSRLQPLSTSC